MRLNVLGQKCPKALSFVMVPTACLAIQSCVALPLAYIALSTVALVWGPITLINLSRGGTLELRFAEEGKGTKVNRDKLSKIKRIAVLPGTFGTSLADRLEKDKKFEEVITPSIIQETDEGQKYVMNSPQMTSAELSQSIATIGKAVKSDAVLRIIETQGTLDTSSAIWLGRFSASVSFAVEIVAAETNEIVLHLKGEATANYGGSGPPNEEEINNIIVPRVISKLYEYSGRQ